MNKLYYIIIFLLIFTSCQNRHTSEDDDYDDVDNGKCKWKDGTYSAIVDYNNPETNYSATYTLDVIVEDCQVIQIDFPNNGYLDEDHISAADLDKEGFANVEGEEGKTYDVQIDD